MQFILLFIIVIQFTYIIYKDVSFGKEREKFFLKLMSKDINEYTQAIEDTPEEAEEKEEDIYVPLEQVSVEQVLKAEDKT